MKKAKKQTKQTVLGALCAALQTHYKSQGDKIAAGVHVAMLEDGTFYASIKRFHGFKFGDKQEEIVINTKWARGDLLTVEAAVEEVARRWFARTAPPKVEQAREALRKSIGA